MGDGVKNFSALPWITDPLMTFPPTTGWTTTTLASATIGAVNDGRLITAPTNAGKAIRGEYRTLSPTSNYTATAYIEPSLPVGANPVTGIMLRDAGGQIITFGMAFFSATNSAVLSALKWTSQSVFSATYSTDKTVYQIGAMAYWLRIRDDGTTRFFEYSFNSVDWLPHYSIGRTDFLTPTLVGWCVDNDGSGVNAYARLRSWVVA
jgi:hypothetical protein